MVGVVPTVLEVVKYLNEIPAGDGFSPGPTIYGARPWTLDGDADGGTTESGYHYLLEVDLALEVIEVWSDWRGGTTPTPEEAALAIIYYAKHDAYQPLA
jgi:hypothetical protein